MLLNHDCDKGQTWREPSISLLLYRCSLGGKGGLRWRKDLSGELWRVNGTWEGDRRQVASWKIILVEEKVTKDGSWQGAESYVSTVGRSDIWRAGKEEGNGRKWRWITLQGSDMTRSSLAALFIHINRILFFFFLILKKIATKVLAVNLTSTGSSREIWMLQDEYGFSVPVGRVTPACPIRPCKHLSLQPWTR